MKKLIALLLSLITVFSFSSCSKNNAKKIEELSLKNEGNAITTESSFQQWVNLIKEEANTYNTSAHEVKNKWYKFSTETYTSIKSGEDMSVELMIDSTGKFNVSPFEFDNKYKMKVNANVNTSIKEDEKTKTGTIDLKNNFVFLNGKNYSKSIVTTKSDNTKQKVKTLSSEPLDLEEIFGADLSDGLVNLDFSVIMEELFVMFSTAGGFLSDFEGFSFDSENSAIYENGKVIECIMDSSEHGSKVKVQIKIELDKTKLFIKNYESYAYFSSFDIDTETDVKVIMKTVVKSTSFGFVTKPLNYSNYKA